MGIAFVLPSFLMVLGIGWAYVVYGGLAWMQSVFYAVGASVIGIIAVSAYRLTRKTVGAEFLLWMIYLSVMAVTVVTESETIAVCQFENAGRFSQRIVFKRLAFCLKADSIPAFPCSNDRATRVGPLHIEFRPCHLTKSSE